MQAARASGAIVSYDANFRALLWDRRGGRLEAQRINHQLAEYADVIFGNEDDFTQSSTAPQAAANDDEAAPFRRMSEALPNVHVISTTRREVHSASVNEWSGLLYTCGELYCSSTRELEIYDRVGGGDAFAAGVIYGLLEDKGAQWAVECGAAHGALVMTTPGDTSMATLAEVERVMRGDAARAIR